MQRTRAKPKQYERNIKTFVTFGWRQKWETGNISAIRINSILFFLAGVDTSSVQTHIASPRFNTTPRNVGELREAPPKKNRVNLGIAQKGGVEMLAQIVCGSSSVNINHY